ncbi:MAG: hypothetical protein JWR19_3654 [Pedosphaera sp.]|nr:hypothetical protein [Pedosphaera sp.]
MRMAPFQRNLSRKQKENSEIPIIMKTNLFLCIFPKALLGLGLAAILSGQANAQTPQFVPGKIAVLQLGDGGPDRGAVGSDIWASRQNPYMVDQFEPNVANQTTPTYQVAVPTNGPTSLWVNGNAGTEGNMTLSADKSLLTFGGYCGDICSIFPTTLPTPPLAPSNLSYDRGIGTVDAFGTYSNVYRGPSWYGIAQGKTNPRGGATDGLGNFWGCGNGYGSLYFNANTQATPIQIQNVVLTSCTKIFNGALYSSVKSGETGGLAAGIYSSVDFFLNPLPFPTAASFPHLEIPADINYQKCIGFDINPQGNVAYVADSNAGIQKYVKTGQAWKLAYNLSIPGYVKWNTGIRTNAGSIQTLVGCFSVAVDWSGANPVVFATTGDGAGSDPRDAKSGFLQYYGNRVIRINDTNVITSGANLIATTNILTTVVQAPVPNPALGSNYVIYKSVTLTPDLRPTIVTNPASWSAVVGDNVSFTVAATAKYALTYQWLQNGTNVTTGGTSTTLNLNAVDLTMNNFAYQCVVSDTYGSVTSSIATLTVTAAATLPTFGAVQNITNFVGNNFNLTASIGGTDPKGGFQWYTNGVALTDGGEFTGTGTKTLSIINAQTSDSTIYSLVATNVAGSASNAVINLTVAYAAPLFVQPPTALTTFTGRDATFIGSTAGYLLTNKWYSSKSSGSGLVLIPISGRFSQTDTSLQPATSTLQITGTVAADATNYVLVVSNPSGSITSAPVALTLFTQPAAHTFVTYTNNGQAYAQNFDALPTPGGGSYEAANPQNMAFVVTNFAAVATNISFSSTNASVEIDYSLDNPVDFGYPVIPAGGIGGFGVSNRMSGWYGWSRKPLFFAATSGDQSAAGLIDNGLNYNNINGLTVTTTNRALGLLTSSKSDTVAFGVAIINNSGHTLNSINVGFTGELWRNNPIQQPLLFGYEIDPSGTSSSFPTNDVINTTLSYVSGLTVAFPTSVDTQVYDGTQSINQTNLAVSGMSIADWAPGETLWLVWQSSTSLGGAQNVAIDNLNFAAGVLAAPTVVTQPATAITSAGATLNASVNPNSLTTAYYFRYGTSTSYGSVTATNSLTAGLSAVPAGGVIGGLLPGTTYHFQAVATNSLGTTLGTDMSFTTTVAVTPPQIGGVVMSGSGLQFSFTNAPGVSFTVLSTTNVSLPLNQWQNAGNPTEGPAGQYQFADPQTTNAPQKYYILRQP